MSRQSERIRIKLPTQETVPVAPVNTKEKGKKERPKPKPKKQQAAEAVPSTNAASRKRALTTGTEAPAPKVAKASKATTASRAKAGKATTAPKAKEKKKDKFAPPSINVDLDGSDTELPHPNPVVHKDTTQSSDSYRSGASDTGSNSSGSPSDPDEEVQLLRRNPAQLKAALQGESATIKHSGAQRGLAEEVSPRQPHTTNLSTAAAALTLSLSPEAAQLNGNPVIPELDIDESSEAEDLQLQLAPKQPKSKRKLRQEAEAPTIRAAPSAMNAAVAEELADSSEQPQLVQWPQAIDLIFNGKSFKKNSQCEEIQILLTNGIYNGLGNLFFTNTYPNLEERQSQTKELLIQCAEKHAHSLGEAGEKGRRFSLISARVQQERAYRSPLIEYVEKRYPQRRKDVMDVVQAKTPVFFGFRPNEPNNAIKIIDGCLYHYGSNRKDPLKPDNSSPYGSSLLSDIVAGVLFRDKSWYHHYESWFESSIQELPDEYEIPEALVAFIACCIHWVIEKWQSKSAPAGNMETNQLQQGYAMHVASLQQYRAKCPDQYHETMHKMYCDARGLSRASKEGVTGYNPLAQFLNGGTQ